MKTRFAEFLKSILAGIMISIGCMVFLSCENKYIGSFLFSIGLITVVVFDLNLYTGKIGYVLDKDRKFFIDTLFSVVGNFIGCFLCGILKSPVGSVAVIAENKLLKTFSNLFADAVFCGIMIYVCVEIFKRRNSFIGILFCIPVFILCGFEHSVADMFYFINANSLSLKAAVFLITVIIGNAVGGLFFPVVNRFSKFLRKEKK